MMRRAIPLLITATSLLLVPEASAGTETFSSPGSSEFSLHASNGYKIFVGRSHREVTLIAFHPRTFASAVYTVRGRSSAERIDANFGKLGRISVGLRTKRVRRTPLGKGCSGSPPTTRFGVFTGTIRFRGEGGYTSVDARGARGRVDSRIRETCPFSPFRSRTLAGSGRRHPPELEASEGRRRGFGAEALLRSKKGEDSILFEAVTLERRGRIEIFRTVTAVGGPASLSFADNLSTATARPPEPFQGEATFERGQNGGASWSGTLSASFPGRDDVPLAGPRFAARLRPYAPD
jgi:hypothetical protein